MKARLKFGYKIDEFFSKCMKRVEVNESALKMDP